MGWVFVTWHTVGESKLPRKRGIAILFDAEEVETAPQTRHGPGAGIVRECCEDAP
jgi:hypothetical protein